MIEILQIEGFIRVGKFGLFKASLLTYQVDNTNQLFRILYAGQKILSRKIDSFSNGSSLTELSNHFDTVKAAAQAFDSSSVFGSGNLISKEEDETQTSQTSFQQKVQLVVPNGFSSGDYEIKAYAEFQVSRTNRSGFVELIHNSSNVVSQTDREPKDTTDWFQFYAFDQRVLSPNDTLQIRFKSEQSNTTIKIRKARIRIFRVS